MGLFDCVAGSVYFYSQMGSSWSRQGKILAADGAANDQFGYFMSIYTSSALIGTWSDDDKATDAGEYTVKYGDVMIIPPCNHIISCRVILVRINSSVYILFTVRIIWHRILYL
jgi:hypothetical protein